jgi:hypothetical protein
MKKMFFVLFLFFLRFVSVVNDGATTPFSLSEWTEMSRDQIGNFSFFSQK